MSKIDLVQAIIMHDMLAIKKEIDAGIDLNSIKYNADIDPLILSIHIDNMDICKLLLDNNFNPNNFSLHYVCKFNNIKFIEILLHYGADPNIPNKYKNYPLIHSLNSINRTHTTSVIKLLLDYKADPNISDANGNTPLHFASSLNHLSAVKLLLEHNANPNISNNNGDTPLISCCNNSKIIKLLLEYGASINYQNNQGLTSLMNRLIIHSDISIDNILKSSKILLDNNADITIQNYNGDTFLIFACQKNFNIIIKFILEYTVFI